MTIKAVGRREVLRGMLIVGGGAFLAACGRTEDGHPTLAQSPGTPADSGAFPVTIDHAYGQTVIETQPQRVAVIGIGDVDSVLALGVTPVLTAVWPGSTDTGVGEWAVDKVTGSAPTPLENGTADFSFEDIAAAEPDVIIAVNNAIDEDRYVRLSSIAPTVLHAAGTEDWVVPWEEITERVGQALGKPRESSELVTRAQSAVSSAAASKPELAGKTAVLVIRWGDGKLRAFGPESARFQILAGLGFVAPASLVDKFTNGLNFEISEENYDLLDADVLVFDNWEKHRADMVRSNIFMRLPVVEEGRMVKLDAVLSDALSMPTPLSIPWSVDKIVAQLPAV